MAKKYKRNYNRSKGRSYGAKGKKKNYSSKRDLNGIRSYWVGVGIALGHAGNGNVKPYFENARNPKSMDAGFNKEMNSRNMDTPSSKANLFK